MSNKENIVTQDVEELDTNTVYATLIKKDDGYHVVDFDGTEGPVCKIVGKPDDVQYVALTPNKANRQWATLSKVEKAFAEGADHIDLFYKASKKFGPIGNKLPNEKLISYLSEDLQQEYRDIIARARAAKEADKKKPMTAVEKAQAKIAKLQEELAKLMEEDGGNN